MGVRVCATPGCPELTTHRSGKCDGCRSDARRASDAKRPSARERGYDARWEATRAAYLAAYPDCEEPACFEPATDVDHVDGLGPLGPHGHDWTNLRSYCHTHHSRRTARDQPGGWHRSRMDDPSSPEITSMHLDVGRNADER